MGTTARLRLPAAEGSSSRQMVAALVLATVSSTFPGFLIGALSVQVSADLRVSESTYGWGLGSFFLAATVGSILLGRLAQRIGPRRQLMVGLSISAASQLALAAFADRFAYVIAALAVCGLVNAGNQTAVNLALAKAGLNRLGLAMAIKQSGMPSASLLSGFAVPVIALTVGWRWGYVAGAIIALAALGAVGVVLKPADRRVAAPAGVVSSAPVDLWLAAASGAFMAFCAGALNAWIVGSGVDAGLGEGMAGLMLSLGAGAGIALRLAFGFRTDRMRQRPYNMAAATMVVGMVGMALLVFRSAPLHVVATVIAFSGGWVWPVFTNFGVVRSNPDGAAAATGVTQMGVYVGVFVAPLLTGWLIEHHGYQVMWSVVTASAIVGSVFALVVAERF